jgi:hypothetical protein
MATSGETNWPLTAGELVQQAMVQIGALSSGDSPEASEMTDGLVTLNSMLKTWSRKVNLWRDGTATLLIAGGTGGATLEQEVRDVNSVRQVISSTNYRLLTAWNRDQYLSLPNRAAAGNPTIYYVKRDLDSVQIRIWPVPATDITLHLDYSMAAQTVTASNETLDIGQEWGETVILNLAARLAGIFGASRMDPQLVATVTQRAAILEQELFDSDRPDSIVFQSWTGDSCCA